MATKPKIRYGTGLKKLTPQYAFKKLVKPGDFFEVTGSQSNWASIRTQAAKQGKKRGIKFSVNRVDKTPKAKRAGVVVRLDYYLTPAE